MHSLHSVGRSTSLRLRRLALAVGCAAALALTPGDARAQSRVPEAPAPALGPDDIPAHLAVVDGSASIERDGRVDAAAPNQVLLAGDRLRTDRGRAEILFEDGSAIDLDEDSAVDLRSGSLAQLLAGRLHLALASGVDASDYRVDSVAGTAWLRTPGEYRLALAGPADDPQVELVVLRGTAELSNDLGRTLVRAGTAAAADASHAPSLPYAVSVASTDAFTRWSEDRRTERLGYASARYLPDDLQVYAGDFDRNGSWLYDASYGYVWYPRVTSTWRPYYDGRWSLAGTLGWIWVGVERWSWPTHHYGRWGLASNRWFWIPDRRWAPAWVSWASAPGYVGWCPLGFDGRPVFSLGVSIGSRDPWRAWTLVPAPAFVPNVFVARTAVARQNWNAAVWSRFSVRSTIPVPSPSTRLRTTGASLRAPGPGPSAVRRADTGVPSAASGRLAMPSRIAPSRPVISAPSSAVPRRAVPGAPHVSSPRTTAPLSRVPSRSVPSWQAAPAAPAIPRWRTVEPPRLTTPRATTPRAVTPSAPPRPSLPSRTAPSIGGVHRIEGSPRPAPAVHAPSSVAPGRTAAPRGRVGAPAPARPSGSGAVRSSGGRSAGAAGSARGQAVRRGGGGSGRQ